MAASNDYAEFLEFQKFKRMMAAGAAPVPAPVAPYRPPFMTPSLAPSVRHHEPVDLSRTLTVLMSWNPVATWKHPAVICPIQQLYAERPDCFEIMGGIHTSEDGTRSYFSVKVNHPKYRALDCVLHIYGSHRGIFKVKSVTVFNRDRTYEDAILTASTPPVSEVGSWVGDE